MNTLRRHHPVLSELVPVAVGIALGLQVFRLFFGSLSWNLREHFPLWLVASLAFAACVTGMLAQPLSERFGGPRPEVRFAGVFSVAWLGAVAWPQPQVAGLLVVGAAAMWLLWLPALLITLAERGLIRSFAPGAVLGVGIDLSQRTALHGVDLSIIQPMWALVGSFTLTALLMGSLLLLPSADGEAQHFHTEQRTAWGPVALGAYLFLQISLLNNLARLEVPGRSTLLPAAALMLLALIGTLLTPSRLPSWIGLSAPIAILAIVLAPGRGWLLVPAQIGAGIALARAFTETVPDPAAIYRGWRFGAALLFLLTVGYYAPPSFDWPVTWLAGALILMAPRIPNARPVREGVTTRTAASGVVLAGSVGLLIAGFRSGTPPDPGAAASTRIKVLTFNVHYGWAQDGAPSAPRVAAFLRERDADLIALQEVSRGDVIYGGFDLVGYLRQQLPGYEAVFGPSRNSLTGNAILSRLPIRDSGWIPYTLRNDSIARNMTWALVPTAAGEALFVSTHFSAYFGSDHPHQAREVARFWAQRPRTLIAGDLNSAPGSEPVEILRQAGLRDLLVPLGLGSAPTFRIGSRSRRLDYIWSSPDIVPLSAEIPRSALSDHLPVEVTVELRR